MQIRYFFILILAFSAGILAIWFVNGSNNASSDKTINTATSKKAPDAAPENDRVYNSAGSAIPSDTQTLATTSPLNITSKPRAQYTDAAREQSVEGTVILRVTFSKNGSIGEIQVIQGLGYGLTEQAIAAAKEIVFQPKKINNTPVSVTKTVEYNFNIY